MYRLSFLFIISFLIISCKKEVDFPQDIKNKEWVELFNKDGKYYVSSINDNVITTKKDSLNVMLMELYSLKISKVENTSKGYNIFTYNNWYEQEEIGQKVNPWYFSFQWLNKEKGICSWEYIANDSVHKDFSFITVDKNNFDKKIYPKLKNDRIETNKKEKHVNFMDSISKLSIDSHWNKEYNVWLSSYTPSYNYAYKVKVSKDSSYVQQRELKDLLVPLQKKDTLFLYHKQNLLEEYIKDKTKPELKIVKINEGYYINSQLFDLKNSISDKPTEYGFLVDELK